MYRFTNRPSQYRLIKQLLPDSELPTLIILKNTVAGFGISYKDASKWKSAPVAPEG